jgi:RimJ/RimL family protein N-acetyltransferase
MWLSERLILRPVTQADLSFLEAWADEPGGQNLFNYFGLRRSSQLQEQFARDGLLTDQTGTLMVCLKHLEHTRVGSIEYRQVHYGPSNASMAYELGIEIAPEYRSKGYGTEAQKALAAYLFSAYPVHRVQATTDTANLPEARALEKAGFKREGVLRQAQWRMGEYHDLVVFSKLRGES